MKKRKDTSRVTIEIYDEDGLLCESVGGLMTHQEVKDKMIDVLRNDGIPVIRQYAKHAPLEDDSGSQGKQDEMSFTLQAMAKMLEKWGKPTEPGKAAKIEMHAIPMVLDYEFDGIKFHACGHPLDVHAANNALLKRIFEEEN